MNFDVSEAWLRRMAASDCDPGIAGRLHLPDADGWPKDMGGDFESGGLFDRLGVLQSDGTVDKTKLARVTDADIDRALAAGPVPVPAPA